MPDSDQHINIPPHDVDAEQSVLGSLMISPDAWDRVADIIVADDFYKHAHRLIFNAIIRLINNNQSIDYLTIKSDLENHDQIEEAGGRAYLIELAKNTPSASNVAAYANAIRERAVIREVISAAHDIAETGFNPQGRDSKEILDIAETKVFEIAEKRTKTSEGPIDVKVALKSTIDRIDDLAKQGSEVTGVSSGFTDLDKMTSGLQPADLVIVAARPSMGKCIVSGSKIIDPDTGKLNTIDDLVSRNKARVLSVDNRFKTIAADVSQFVDDGLKPVFKVTTALGKVIETTLTHPFLTGDGWLPLEKISVGQRVAIPRSLPVFGTERPPENHVKAIGYMVSDGCTTNKSPTFTNDNPEIAQDFIACMEQFSGITVNVIQAKNRAQSYRVSARNINTQDIRQRFAQYLSAAMSKMKITGGKLAFQLGLQPSTISQWRNAHAMPLPTVYDDICDMFGGKFKQDTFEDFQMASCKVNAVTEFLDINGLNNCKAHEKALPLVVYSWDENSLILLLNRMFACDGSAFAQANGQSRITYATSSEVLAEQVQHLLLRFGIIAKKRSKVSKYKNAQNQFEIEIMGQESIITFVDKIGILGKTSACEAAKNNVLNKRAHSNVDSVPLSVNEYIMLLKGQRTWRDIFESAKKTFPNGFNPHLTGKSQRHLSRRRLAFFADLFDDQYLFDMANSDVYWDKVTGIEYQGYKQVYDLTVPEYHNFVAQDVFVHNTTFAMNLCENAMMLQDKPVLVFSLEMPYEQIMMRMLASLGRINQTSIRTARLNDDDWFRLQQVTKELADKDNLYIDDSSGLTPMELRTRARKLARERGGLSLIMVDYLQLMRVPNIADNRTLEIAEISRSLKALAKELNVPVVALSQLNRGLEQRADKRPINSDLRESGAIEQDADLIMFIYRDEVYHENSDQKGVAEIIIGKQRNGPIGTCRLTFQGQFSRFDNYAGPDLGDAY